MDIKVIAFRNTYTDDEGTIIRDMPTALTGYSCSELAGDNDTQTGLSVFELKDIQLVDVAALNAMSDVHIMDVVKWATGDFTSVIAFLNANNIAKEMLQADLSKYANAKYSQALQGIIDSMV